MLLFKSTTLVLLLTLISQVVSNIVEMATYADGSYSWSKYTPDSTIPSRDVMRSKVLSAFQDMADQVRQMQSFNPAYSRPSTMAVLYVFGKGYVYHSSIRGVSATSEATLGIMNDQCPHQYQGNCAEMGAIALAEGAPNNFVLKSSYIVVYGVDPSNNAQLGYLQPCHPNGCAQYIDNRGIVPITKRDAEDSSQQGVPAIAGRRSKRALIV